MRARINRLYVNNYRCLVNFELRPGRTTLLLGYNGTGKSSVLDVLYAIKSLVVGNVDVKEAFPTDTVTKFGGASKQRLELDIETEHGTLRYVLLLTHDLEEKTVAITLEELALDDTPVYRFANDEVQIYTQDGSPARASFPSSPLRSFLAVMDPKLPHSPVASFKHFLDHFAILRLDPVHIDASAPEEHSNLRRDASDFASYCRFLLQEQPELMQRAEETLREIIPGFQRLRMQSAGRAKVLVAALRYPAGDAYDLDFDMLSDGQKALAVLYVVLHSVAHSIPLLCLDEPDNFVSIREIQPFLNQLFELGDETGLQVILISHSSEIIDYIGPSGAVLLERPDGGLTRTRPIEVTGTLRLSELMARGWLPGGANGAS